MNPVTMKRTDAWYRTRPLAGDEEEQPRLNLALLGLINHGVGVTCTQLRETVTTLATNCPTAVVLVELHQV